MKELYGITAKLTLNLTRDINEFDWENLFFDKNINEQLNLFSIVILNIFKNVIPNGVISCDDKDPP